MNKKKSYYNESNIKTADDLIFWKDLRDEKGEDIYTEFNNSKEIVFNV